MKKKLVVIGGGAAGFFCAVNAARINPLLDVILLEKSSKLLSKVKVSGGGRCNVTHACFDITEMSKRYPRGTNFVKKSFHRFFTSDTVEWFQERGVALKAEADGRMFPVTDSSQTIINCLLSEANQYGVQIKMHAEVKNIEPLQDHFKIHLPNQTIVANYVCVASGGFPKLSMFDWLKHLGHTIEEPIPSLFTFNMPAHPITKLMGISVENVIVKIRRSKLQEQGPLLITHWGLSGPAILKLSAWGARELNEKNYAFSILVNWLPIYNEISLKQEFQSLRFSIASQKISHKNPFGLPARLWEFLLHQSKINPDITWSNLPAKEQNMLIKNLVLFEADIKGKTTFKEEFVTAGGIRLTEVDANTMMSRKVENVFFAGEILDVDGITGGYNFQHAWTSGWIAANEIAKTSSLLV